jgi:plasmid maintenance system antidote protein VapI
MTIDDPENARRADRLITILDHLKAEGLNQTLVANELNIPANYLSDVKNQQRAMTEPFARALSSHFGVSFTWFWTGQGKAQTPKTKTEGTRPEQTVMLPILSQLHIGPPREGETWDGSLLPLAGRSAEEASKATLPYILRVSSADAAVGFPENALILLSQDTSKSSGMAVVRSRGSLMLAREEGNRWVAVRNGRRISEKAELVGYALGIVWSPL